MKPSSIYDYEAIRHALGREGHDELELEVRHFNGPNWNPRHLRARAAQVYQCVRKPIAWCENPIRFGWGEPGLTWWCTSILAHRKNWDFPIVDGHSLGPVELPSSWQLSCGRGGECRSEEFGSFDAALAALSEWNDHRYP